MKNLTLLTLVLLLTANLFAQKTRTIHNPYYEFSKTGIHHVSKIEMDANETRIYMYSNFIPKWWINFDEDELIDCDTKKLTNCARL